MRLTFKVAENLSPIKCTMSGDDEILEFEMQREKDPHRTFVFDRGELVRAARVVMEHGVEAELKPTRDSYNSTVPSVKLQRGGNAFIMQVSDGAEYTIMAEEFFALIDAI